MSEELRLHPGVELFVHKERERIRKRRNIRLAQIESSAKKVCNEQKKNAQHFASDHAVPTRKKRSVSQDQECIDLIDSDEETQESQQEVNDTASTSAAAVPTTTVVPRLPLNPPQRPLSLVPKTIEMLWEQMQELYDRGHVDAPLCPADDCPYCTGPLMGQRFDLMQRLMSLEKLIWLGDKVKRKV